MCSRNSSGSPLFDRLQHERRKGGLRASEDESAGHRYNGSAKGVYLHRWEHNNLAADYSQFCPLFSDSVYVRCMIKCRVDRIHQVKYKHGTQLVQNPNSNSSLLTRVEAERIGWDPDLAGNVPGGPSIYCESIWVQMLDYKKIPN
eukprot:1482057-Karenia_brevis.AAC.1